MGVGVHVCQCSYGCIYVGMTVPVYEHMCVLYMFIRLHVCECGSMYVIVVYVHMAIYMWGIHVC